MACITRSGLLRGGVVAAAAALVPTGVARAALPVPQPQGDDVGFLLFAVLGERVAQAYYVKLGERAVAKRRAQAVAKVVAALGPDAPAEDDFEIVLPEKVGPAFGVKVETLLVRTYTGALASTVDGSTRLLLARLLAADAQALTVARTKAGLPAVGGLPVPLDLEAAGAALDALLKVPNYPTT